MLNFCNYSAHTVHDHSSALDSGFRRSDISYHAVFKSFMPAKPVPGVNREPARPAIQNLMSGMS
jgi:hypothetical protein